jgi:kinesin family protein 22
MVILSMGNRIIEIEWAVKNHKEYVPSPKPKKNKNKKKSKSRTVDENDAMDVDDSCGAGGGKNAHPFTGSEFGNEATNTDSPNKSKRSLAELDEVMKETPAKRLKRSALETPTR